jgi:hypothetical protein
VAPVGQRNSETVFSMLALLPYLPRTLADDFASKDFVLVDSAGELWSESALARCIFLSRFTL